MRFKCILPFFAFTVKIHFFSFPKWHKHLAFKILRFFLIAEVSNNSYETDGMVQVKTRIFFFSSSLHESTGLSSNMGRLVTRMQRMLLAFFPLSHHKWSKVKHMYVLLLFFFASFLFILVFISSLLWHACNTMNLSPFTCVHVNFTSNYTNCVADTGQTFTYFSWKFYKFYFYCLVMVNCEQC